jgi:hypothetical protein
MIRAKLLLAKPVPRADTRTRVNRPAVRQGGVDAAANQQLAVASDPTPLTCRLTSRGQQGGGGKTPPRVLPL